MRWVDASAETGEVRSTVFARRCLRDGPRMGDGEALRENPNANRPRI